MELMRKTNIDFMGKKALYLGVFVLALVFSVGALLTRGLNRSVEFTGGAGVTLHYAQAPQLESIRSTLQNAGFPGSTVTTLGDTGGREVSIRVGLGEDKAAREQSHGDLTARIIAALTPPAVRQQREQGLVDLNLSDQVTIAGKLREAGLADADAQQAAAAVTDYRREHAGIIENLGQVTGVPAAARPVLEKHAFAGPFALRGQELIEASVSREMQSKALWASLGALAGMLAYLWFRFQLRWGVGAVVALAFDVFLTLGLFAAIGYEFSLPVVAAFLTLIGYSANDKVVVFDRIRETVRAKGVGSMYNTINESLNDVLSRTIITGICTIAATLSLYLFGGSVLEGFAFVLLAGIIIGTYSSIFVACPFVLFWARMVTKHEVAEAEAKKAAKAGRTGAQPVRR